MMESFLKEGIVMKNFNHPHVLSLLGLCLGYKKEPMVILPFMANGDLRSYIKAKNRVGVNGGIFLKVVLLQFNWCRNSFIFIWCRNSFIFIWLIWFDLFYGRILAIPICASNCKNKTTKIKVLLARPPSYFAIDQSFLGKGFSHSSPQITSGVVCIPPPSIHRASQQGNSFNLPNKWLRECPTWPVSTSYIGTLLPGTACWLCMMMMVVVMMMLTLVTTNRKCW